MESEFTLSAVFHHSTLHYTTRTALAFVDERPFTYADVRREVEHLSHFLKLQGVSYGDRVAIISESCPHWGIAYFAITLLGAIVVPILPDFHASEIHHILRHSESKVIFVSERYFQKIEELDFTKFNAVILLDSLSVVKPQTTKATLRQLLVEGSREIQKIRSMVLELTGKSKTEIHEDDIASIIYTSGTTGHSKGVMLTHKNIVWNAQVAATLPNIIPEDRLLSVLPLAHMYECTIGFIIPFMCGASVYYLKKPPTPTVLLPALDKVKPTAMLTVPLVIEKVYKTQILPEIRKHKITRMLYLLPAMRKKINKIAGIKLKQSFGGSLRFFGIGGSALSPDVEQFLIEAEFPYAIGYGLTETSPLIAGSDAFKTKYRSTGLPLAGTEVRIENADSKTGIGEIVVKGPNVMKGYYRDPERTAEVLSDDGWFHTGDSGFLDNEGYLYIAGRIKNVILGANGENIYPEAIESILNRSDYVIESLVYEENSQLIARVYLDYEKLDAEISSQDLNDSQTTQHIAGILSSLLSEVNQQVSSFSRIARIYEQREPFEKTPTQKIKRYLYVNSLTTSKSRRNL
ncbi:MAG: AMP-binding protein [Bacteroidetes bacterium]|nr:AMP-binding protein [Bacteroidota bacterium]